MLLENWITSCGYHRRPSVPRQSKDRARQYGIRRRMGAGEQHTVHKKLTVTFNRRAWYGSKWPTSLRWIIRNKKTALRFIEERGIGQKDPHHTDGLSVTSPKTERTLCPLGYLPCKCGCRLYILKIRLRRTTEWIKTRTTHTPPWSPAASGVRPTSWRSTSTRTPKKPWRIKFYEWFKMKYWKRTAPVV